MVIKILSSSKSFNGIDYNEKKVEQGHAERLAIDNFDISGVPNKTKLKESLIEHTSLHKGKSNFTNHQFHVAISGKGDSYSKDELLTIGKDYMDNMGYGSNPIAVYFHNDTVNKHIHIVSSRVNNEGQKINDSFEKKRTQDFIKNELGIDYSQNLINKLEQLKTYSYSTLDQLFSILDKDDIDYNIQSKEEGRVIDLYFNRDKILQVPVMDFKINPNIKKEKEKELKKMKAILYKHKDLIPKEHLIPFLKINFGYEMIMNETRNIKISYVDGRVCFNSEKVDNIDWIVPNQFKNEIEKLELSNIYSLRDNVSPDLKKEIQNVIKKLNPIELGYTMIDHKNNFVVKGSDVLKLSKIRAVDLVPFNETYLRFLSKEGFSVFNSYIENNNARIDDKLNVVFNGGIVDIGDDNKKQMLMKVFEETKGSYHDKSDIDYNAIFKTLISSGVDLDYFMKENKMSAFTDSNGQAYLIDEDNKHISTIDEVSFESIGSSFGKGLGALSDIVGLMGGFEDTGITPNLSGRKKKKKKKR